MSNDWTVDPADEQRHVAPADALWNESYYLDVVDAEGRVGGYVRLGFYPNEGVVWWTTALVVADELIAMSTNYELAVPDLPRLGASGPGTEISIEVVEALAGMRVVATAPAEVFGSELEVYDGAGRPAELGIDLTWRTDGEPYGYGAHTRYEIPCLVEGTITLDGEIYEIAGPGQRDHSWGVRDWWSFGWCWMAGRLDDGTRFHCADIRVPEMRMAFGYTQAPTRAVTTVDVTEDLGPQGFPTSGHARYEPTGLELDIEPLGFGPLLLRGPEGQVSHFPRSMARFVAQDGRQGLGWIEWNQPAGR
ncbi:MAG: hypothetical protein WCG96_00055 [Actinomycetes bacterium]